MRNDPEIEQRFKEWVERAKAVDMVSVAGKNLKKVGQEYVGPCHACKGKDRFSINPSKGFWNCRGSRGGHSAVSMLMHTHGLSFLEACRELTGEEPPRGNVRPLSPEQRAKRDADMAASAAEAAARAKADAEDRRRRLETASGVWSGVVPLAGTPSEAYLVRRGIPVPRCGWPTTIGHHRGLVYPLLPDRPILPCLVARVDDAAGDLTAIWRIYVTTDGLKASVPEPKLGLGPAAGGAVRICGVGPCIETTEGLETALAVWTLLGCKRPVFACLSTSGVSGLELPLQVKRVRHWPDGDLPLKKNEFGEYIPVRFGPGVAAANSLRDRLNCAGIGFVMNQIPGGGGFFPADSLDTLNVLAGPGGLMEAAHG